MIFSYGNIRIGADVTAIAADIIFLSHAITKAVCSSKSQLKAVI